jgi:hypothetical protein
MTHHTNIHAITDDFNSMRQNLQFTEELEQDNTLNYLVITIHKTPTNKNSQFTESPLSLTLSFPTILTTPYNTNMQQLNSYITG